MLKTRTIARRWARRVVVALLAGGLTSLSYYALRFVRVGLSAKLLGDAYRLTYRLTQHQRLDPHYYAKILALNALLYATWILVVFGAKDLLGQAREALSSENMRRLVTFCLVQAFGICLVLIEIDPGDVFGAFLLLPGYAVAVWRNGGLAYSLTITLCVNAIAWFAVIAVLGRYNTERKRADWL
jgi:hypothetical protein